jgi:beta-glucosidase
MKKISLLMILCAVFPFGMQAQTVLTAKNIDAVVKAMTLEEKASLLVGYTAGSASYFGLPTSSSKDSKELVPGAAGSTQAIPRFRIPQIVLSDGPAGLRISPTRKDDAHTYYCTGFPIGTCLACTWNRELVNEVGKAFGNEVLEYGADILLAPGMNIQRNPLCGRNFEYYSEDPVLSGLISASIVNGIQSNGVGVSVKHFAANSQETNRTNNNAVVSQRALREIYLKNFELAVKLSNPWTVMSSYNKINGTYTQCSKDLLTTILRDEWGYKGIVVSDWTNTRQTDQQIKAGNDLLMPGTLQQMNDIKAMVANGTLSMADVDVCVKRVLECIVKTPRFKGYQYSNKPDLQSHAQLTRSSSEEGMVLLKNDSGTLPFDGTIKKVALFGITSYNLIAGGTGSGDVNKPYVVDLMEGLKNGGFETDTVLNSLYVRYREFGKYEQEAEMGELSSNSFFSRPRMTEPYIGPDAYQFAAQRNDIAIITIGRKSGEGSDRYVSDFNINPDEKAMLDGVCNAFHQAGKKVVVVMNIGGAMETASWKSQPDAILLSWQPGLEGGNSITDILKGVSNPSGKLSMTFPVSLEDVPSTKNFPKDYSYRNDWTLTKEQIAAMPNVGTTRYEEGIYVGYRYFNTNHVAVSYPFGYGLSYTSFAYSNAKVVKKGSGFVATVVVKNVGDKSGKEAVQLYVAAPKGKLDKPACELKAFAKTRLLKPGESQMITMTFSNYDLASYDESIQSFVTDAGTYQARFGASVEDVRLTVPFKAGSGVVKCHDVLKMQ